MSEAPDTLHLPSVSGPSPDEGSEQSPVPPQVEGYEIREPLGEGGMGTVWRAVQLSTRREVALKVMRKGAFGTNKDRARFEREVQLAARLQHPNIAVIYDSGLHRGMYFYAMELVQGVPAHQYVKDRRLTHREILKLMLTVCEAMQHAHQRGVLHRDLKPSNVLVTPDGQPHIVDFGLAKTFREGDRDARISSDHEAVGTPAYMPPEQALGRKTDCRSDVFSFGVLCYELLTGRPPFEGETVAEVLTGVLTKEPRPIDLLCPEVPAELRRIVSKCLRKDPELRYQDMDGLHVDLRLLEGRVDARESVAAKERKSVAVLPFLSLSDEPDFNEEHFCEEITEDITTDLSKIEGLRVVSRWLAKSCQARGLDVLGVGRELGVDSILQGSVRRSGKRVRITAQLVSVADGFHLWAEKFDREMGDIFAVQDEIAVAIARALRLRLTGVEMERIQRKGTTNPQAYEEFIKGRFHYWYRNTSSDVEAAERHFRRALELDTSYAQAWIGLADVYNMLWVRGSPQRDKLVRQSQEALHHAEEIDPALAYGCYTRAWYHAASGDVMLAERVLQQGLEANSADPMLRCTLGMFQLSRGELRKAEEDLKASLMLDPFLHLANVYLALLQGWYRQNIDSALAHVGEILALAPDFCHALRVKGKCHLLKGDFQGALELLVKANEIDRPWAYHLTMEAIALAGLGRPGEALAKIEESVAENPEPTWGITDQAQALNATVALSISRQLDAAVEWLARTAHIFSNSFNPHLFEILDGFPALDPIRGDERYGRQKKDYLASFTRDAGGSADERKQ